MKPVFIFIAMILCFTAVAKVPVTNTTYTIGVKFSTIGMNETFVLSLGPGKQITVSTNVRVNFPGTYPSGYKYTIKQISGPRKCKFSSGSGTVTTADVEVASDGGVPDGYAILNGIVKAPAGTKIVLENNGVDTLSVTGRPQGAYFTFPKAYMQGTTFNVIVKSGPPGFTYNMQITGGELTTIFPGSFLTVYADLGYDLISRGNQDSVLASFYESSEPTICKSLEDDGRYIAFVSSAKGLAGASGKYRQIFWRDRVTGEIRLISRGVNGEEGNESSYAPIMSVNGRKVAFESYANNLVAGDRNNFRDVFLWSGDMQGGSTIERVSVGPGGIEANAESYGPSISGMGNDIAFSSTASNLTLGVEGTYTVNVFLRTQYTGTTTLISMDPVTKKATGGTNPSIDMNGNRIAFYSFAGNLVPDDKNDLWDIFLYDKRDPNLKRISLAADGSERNQGNESRSRVVAPTISGDGNYIAYASTSSNIVSGDNNGLQDVFVYDIADHRTVRVSVNSNGEEGNGDSPIGQGEKIALSIDGNLVAFTTKASNFGTTEGNVVMFNRSENTMKPISTAKGTYVGTPSISRRGRYIVFGCGEKLDVRFPSSGLFINFTGQPFCASCQ